MRSPGNKTPGPASWVNQDLVIAYVLPYLVYVVIGEILGRFAGKEVVYAVRFAVVSGLLFWAFRWYVPVSGPKSLVGSLLLGFLFGVVGLVLWCGLCAPFIRGSQGDIWSKNAFVLRFVSAGFLVPVFEEWLMRGFVFRIVLQWYQRVKQGQSQAFFHVMGKDNIDRVNPGDWSMPAMLISSLIFALGHCQEEWLAAFAYGILMVLLWIIRKDLVSCMIAHAVTNMGLALYVLYSGHWEFW